MIMPSDKDYKETKQIMLGKKVMQPEFKPLAEWIDKTYGVKTINIFYDTIDKGNRPRLEIYFEHPKGKAQFNGPNGFNFCYTLVNKFKHLPLKVLKVFTSFSLTNTRHNKEVLQSDIGFDDDGL